MPKQPPNPNKGDWKLDREEQGFHALHPDEHQTIQEFALAGNYAAQRNQLTTRIGNAAP